MVTRKNKYDAVIAAPFGRLGIRLADDALAAIDILGNSIPLRNPAGRTCRNICTQLNRYFSNPRHVFDVPLDLPGTAYQQRVWRALRRIPAGRVISYGELARKLRSGARAVGGACRANPAPIVVPCHRVVAAGGDGGYMGDTSGRSIHIKNWLLLHEQT